MILGPFDICIMSNTLNCSCICRLERLTQGANEPSAFLQWQREMREKDLQEELAQLERRRLEGKISHEEALLARQRVLELNQHKAQLKKEEVRIRILVLLHSN